MQDPGGLVGESPGARPSGTHSLQLPRISQVGSYRLLAPMGSGGTGIVIEAVDERDGTSVAVKIAHHAKGWQREVLRKEIQVLGRLGRGGGDPGVVRIHGHGVEAGRLWYAMELVRGIDLGVLAQALAGTGGRSTLRTTASGDEGHGLATRFVAPAGGDLATVLHALDLVIDRAEEGGGQRRLNASLRLMARVARTLAYVHAQAIVHADLSPANIVVRRDGMPVLVDFGTSLHTFVDGVAREAPQGEVKRHGTPGYMAPEQIRGAPFDARADLYALGCILYEMLVGHAPFVGDTPTVQQMHLEADVRPPSHLAPWVPAFVDTLVLDLLQKDPTRRIGFAEDIVATLARWLESGEAVPPPVASGRRLYRAGLHGRAQCLHRLDARLDSAAGGRGGLVLMTGQSGLGKTRMLNEVAARATRRGFEVVVGQCHGSGELLRSHDAPLDPLLAPVRRLADQLFLSGEAVAGPLAEALAALRPFEPGLADLAGLATVEVPALSPELARERLMRAVRTCLSALAEQRPVLLLLDDLQWADELTRGFVASTRPQALGGARILLVGTYRDDEIDPAFAAACGQACEERVELQPLDRGDISALARDMTASATLPEGLVDDVYRASEGNPFFAAECLRAGLDEGVYQRDDEGRWHATAPAISHAGYEAGGRSLARYILPRLARLGPPARRVAELAALLGREFEAEALFAMLPEAGGEANRAGLEELLAHRMVEELSPGRMRFVHDKLRQGCEEAMSEAERRNAHRAAALALEEAQVRMPFQPALAARLGRHWSGAGESTRAAEHLESAGRAFSALHATAEATELLNQALRQLELAAAEDGDEALQDSLGARRAALAEALGDLLALTARHAEARERFAAAAPLQSDPLARVRLLRKSGRSFWTVHRYDEAVQALVEAQAQLEAASDRINALELAQERIEIGQNRFWIAYFSRRFGPEVDELLVEMAAATERHGTVRQLGVYEKCAAMYKLVRGRFRPSEAVIAHARRSLALLESEPGHLTDALEARFSLGFLLVSSTVDDCAEGLALLEFCAASAASQGDTTNLARSLAYATVGLRRLGRVAETVAMATRTRCAAEDAQLMPYLGVASACMAWASWRKSERHDDDASRSAHRLLAEARDWWTRAGHPFPYRWLAEMVGVALAVGADDPNSAVEPLTVLGRPDQFHLPDDLDHAIQDARAACAAEDPTAAQRELTRVLREAARACF